MTNELKVSKTKLDGVLVVEPSTNFTDHRGQYVEIYNRPLFEKAGITCDFIQDDISVSKRNVLRGLHGDATTTKLVSCLHGKLMLAVVNWDPEAPQFGQWETFTLSDENRLAVLIPPKFANGHLIQSDIGIFHYKQTGLYHRDSQFTVMWNDPKLGIPWPITDPILSRRDMGEE